MALLKLISVTERVHFYLKNLIKNGNTVIDATAGQGHDTLLLAKLVGDEGKVYAFDIQKTALEKTQKKLVKEKLIHRVEIIHDSHSHLDSYEIASLDAAVFNLGYLPGGDHSIITQAETTCDAISHILKKLKIGGIIIITSYREHSGGMEEYTSLKKHLLLQEKKGVKTTLIHPLTENKKAPVIFIIQKEL